MHSDLTLLMSLNAISIWDLQSLRLSTARGTLIPKEGLLDVLVSKHQF